MSTYLLDSNALIWALDQYEKLNSTTQNLINDTNNTLFISHASLWEIAIKVKKGTLALNVEHMVKVIDQSDYKLLSIDTDHILKTLSLPLHHKDPFDRILIAQSMIENIPIITSDKMMDKYDIRVISAS